MAELDSSGKIVKLTLADYPYADDGKLVWEAVVAWVKEYLSLTEVKPDDVEFLAWWDEIKCRVRQTAKIKSNLLFYQVYGSKNSPLMIYEHRRLSNCQGSLEVQKSCPCQDRP